MLQIDKLALEKSRAHITRGEETFKIVAIDDDLDCVERIEKLMSHIEGATYLYGFTDALEGVAYLKQHQADLVFLAIEMLDIKGIAIAKEIEKIVPTPAVCFVTNHSCYSYEAWRTNAVYCILKPVEKEDLECAIMRGRYYKLFKKMEAMKNINPRKIEMRCFPSFDVFVDDEIVEFANGKVKELLAFLVYQQGHWCTIDQIVFCVLEKHAEKSGKQYYRTLMYRLKRILQKYGIEYILETGYGRARVKPLYYNCEYYEYLKGNKELFQGAFMGTYLWAEEAVAFMTRESIRKKN